MTPRYAAGILALVLLVVPASAEAGGEHVLQYRGFVVTDVGTNGAVAETNVVMEDAHTWESLGGQSILEVQASYVTQSGGVQNPQADYQVLWNGTALDTCNWHIQGGTVGGGRWNPFISLYCLLPEFVTPGNYTIEVERTNVSGQPVVHSVTSIILHQTETVNMDLNLHTAFDSLLPVLWLAVLWFATWRMSLAGPRYLGMFLFASLGAIDAILSALAIIEVPGLQEAALFGLLLSIAVVAVSDRFGSNTQVQP